MESSDSGAEAHESIRRIVRCGLLTPRGRQYTARPYSFPVADSTPEWLAHAAPIMVCVGGCGLGHCTHHVETGLCSSCWLDARRRGEV